MPFHPQRFIFALLFSVSATIVSAQALIPVPAHINPSKGEYRFRPIEKIIITDTSLQNEATELKKSSKNAQEATHISSMKKKREKETSASAWIPLFFSRKVTGLPLLLNASPSQPLLRQAFSGLSKPWTNSYQEMVVKVCIPSCQP